jgi:hypothetical protein
VAARLLELGRGGLHPGLEGAGAQDLDLGRTAADEKQTMASTATAMRFVA